MRLVEIALSPARLTSQSLRTLGKQFSMNETFTAVRDAQLLTSMGHGLRRSTAHSCPSVRYRHGVAHWMLWVCLAGIVGVPAMPAAEVWVAETLQRDDRPLNNRVLLHPVGLEFDALQRPVVAWTESGGIGGGGSVFWARREDGQWRTTRVTQFNASGVLSFNDPRGGAALTVASNGVPFLFHANANFANSEPFFLTRMNLETTPEGPGGFVTLLPGSASLSSTFDGDGRRSFPPDYVTWVDRGRLRWNGSVDLTADGVLKGNAAQVVFRQGPERQVHVLYQTDDGRIHYNGGGPDRDQTILMGNTGSTTYSMAVDDANGVHVVAAEGTGRFFFGAVGRLTYLYSADGKTWTKQGFPQVAEDLGATAIALDSRQRPVVALLRAFSSLMFMGPSRR